MKKIRWALAGTDIMYIVRAARYGGGACSNTSLQYAHQVKYVIPSIAQKLLCILIGTSTLLLDAP